MKSLKKSLKLKGFNLKNISLALVLSAAAASPAFAQDGGGSGTGDGIINHSGDITINGPGTKVIATSGNSNSIRGGGIVADNSLLNEDHVNTTTISTG